MAPGASVVGAQFSVVAAPPSKLSFTTRLLSVTLPLLRTVNDSACPGPPRICPSDWLADRYTPRPNPTAELAGNVATTRRPAGMVMR